MKAFASIVSDATTGNNRLGESEVVSTIWREYVATADEYNAPGRFTTMIGFEWSTMPGGNNIHRIVLFRDGADRTSRTLPFGTFDSEDLW